LAVWDAIPDRFLKRGCMSRPVPADADKPVEVGPLHPLERDRQVRVDRPHQQPPVARRPCASNEEFIAFVAAMRPDLELRIGDNRYVYWVGGHAWEWSNY
jgi:hypothetical protein